MQGASTPGKKISRFTPGSEERSGRGDLHSLQKGQGGDLIRKTFKPEGGKGPQRFMRHALSTPSPRRSWIKEKL